MTDFNQRLTTLFNQRAYLNKTEGGELYGIINRILTAYKGWSFDDPTDKEDAINDFYLTKILAPASGNFAVYDHCSAGLIIGMFKNFMKDRDRKAGQFDIISLDVEDEENQAKQEKHWEDSRSFDFSPDQLEETLFQYHLSQQQLVHAASDFFNHLEAYAQLVISRHLCTDAEQALPISSIQQHYPQTATYYKINKLGILHKTNSLPADYDRTAIGHWLKTTLHIEITPNHMSIIAIALQILCVVALQAIDA